jgi:hypothetical protein
MWRVRYPLRFDRFYFGSSLGLRLDLEHPACPFKLRVLVVFELTPLLNPRKLRPIFSRVGLHGCQSPRRLTRTVRKKVRAYHIRRHARARNGRWAMSARGEADAVRSRSSFLAAAEPLARGDWMSASCPHQAAFVATMRRSSRGRRATGGSDERDGLKGAAEVSADLPNRNACRERRDRGRARSSMTCRLTWGAYRMAPILRL